MADLGDILLITLITSVISASLTFWYKSRKISRKDYRREDDAKNRKPDITIGL